MKRESRATRKRLPTSLGRAFNPAWLVLVEILRRVEEQPYHWPVGRTTFQKIAYVATREGLPTGFTYERGSFGPFAKELKAAQAKLINSNLLQEEQLGKMFQVKVGPAFEKTRGQHERLLREYADIVKKAADLFMRVDTVQAEILATVLFAAEELKASNKAKVSERQVLDAVMDWKQRRRPPLDEASVALTIRNLGMLGWLEAEPDAELPLPEDAALCS